MRGESGWNLIFKRVVVPNRGGGEEKEGKEREEKNCSLSLTV